MLTLEDQVGMDRQGGMHVKPRDDRNHLKEQVVQDGWTTEADGRSSRRMPCRAVGYNMESNGESVMR